VTDNMLAAAAHAVSELVDTQTPGAPLLPRVEALRETSAAVAAAVAQAAAADGVARARLDGDVRASVRALMWEPVYRPVRPA
jgi:malate dehydrogenase (oxaloacetate-decarboxylating)